MRDGVCPKCRSEQVFVAETGSLIGAKGTEPQLMIHIYKDKRFMPDVDLLMTDTYLCQSCGYFETYVQDVGKLGKLNDSDNWRRVK